MTAQTDDDFNPFAEGPVERVLRTSESQREIWLANQWSPEASLAYNEAVWLRLLGPLDVPAFEKAIAQWPLRHEVLRSRFTPDGLMAEIGAAEPLRLTLTDLRALPPAEREASRQAAHRAAVHQPFVLEAGKLLVRAQLLQLGDHDWELVASAHHIVCDGWSWAQLLEDLGALYAEQIGQGPTPDAPPSFADYVQWEASDEVAAQRELDLAYWLAQYRGTHLPVLDLPVDRPRPPLRTFGAGRVDHTLDAPTMQGLKQLAGQRGVSTYGLLLSGFAATLARITGQDEVVIGVATAGQAASGMHGVVGHCVNLLPVRMGFDGSLPFAQHVSQCSGVLLDALDHQLITYGALLKSLQVPRDPSRPPLAAVHFNLDVSDNRLATAFPGLQASAAGIARAYENAELFVNAVHTADGGLRLEAQHNAHLFDAASVARWLSAFEFLLKGALRDANRPVGQLDWLSPAALQELQALQVTPTPRDPAELFHHAFERQAAAHPSRVALRFEGQTLSYGELNAQANGWAQAIAQLGVQSGELVAVCLPRGIAMVVAQLAVLKAGAGILPLDPSLPAQRLLFCAKDANAAALITQRDVNSAPLAWRGPASDRVLYAEALASLRAESGPAITTQGADAAYMIYTSGSTGEPKGAIVNHRGAVNVCADFAVQMGITADDRMGAVTTYSFDLAQSEMMVPLGVGGEVVMVSQAIGVDSPALAELIDREQITTMMTTPARWRMLIDAGWKGSAKMRAFTGGETLAPDLALAMEARTLGTWNGYGPSETAIVNTLWRVDGNVVRDRGVALGPPVANNALWVVDAQMQPCPVGVPGELCIGGVGVGNGYVNRPELNADRFVPDRFGGGYGGPGLMYRSGDRVRWRNDGLLEHLGRLDFQVKIRGFRVEMGEIEAAILTDPAIAQCVVIAREAAPGDLRLVAYLVAKPQHIIDDGRIQSTLMARLPSYMVPKHRVVLERLPAFASGKLDRRSLPDPDWGAARSSERVAPRNDAERQVTALMEEVLSLPELSITDDFFALGGHSLLAARLIARINREFSINLPLTALFEAPTAGQLAHKVGQAQQSGQTQRAPIERLTDPSRAPLTVMQQRIVFMHELHPDRVTYNAPSAHRLQGPMDVEVFKAALRAVAERQSAMRTCLAHDASGQAYLRILPEVAFDIPYTDLSSVPASEQSAELLRRMQAVVDQPFDLTVAPLFRVAIYKLAEDTHALLYSPHHLIWDGYSFDIFYRDVATAYGCLLAGRAPDWAPLPVSYGDYAAWHNTWLGSPEAKAQQRFWEERFATAPMPKAPHPDKPRQAGRSGVGRSVSTSVDKALTERLRALAREAGCTLSMAAMGLYAALLSRAVGSPHVVIGMPTRGRLMTEVEPVMGFFNNLLAVQLNVRPELTMLDFMREVKQELLTVMANQDIPFETLSVVPHIAARARRVGLYQALFSFQDARDRERQWGNLQQSNILIFQKNATEDLGMWLMDEPWGLEGGFKHNADLYEDETAQAFLDRYFALLRDFVETPHATVGELLSRPHPGDERLARLAREMPADSVLESSEFASESLQAAAAAAAAGASPAAAGVPGAANPPEAQASWTDTQRQLAQVWAQVLGLPAAQIRLDHNFFDLGGDSLQAMNAIAAMHTASGLRCDPRRYVFESLAQLASPQADESQGPGEANAAAAVAGQAPGQAPTPDAGEGLVSRVLGGLFGKGKR